MGSTEEDGQMWSVQIRAISDLWVAGGWNSLGWMMRERVDWSARGAHICSPAKMTNNSAARKTSKRRRKSLTAASLSYPGVRGPPVCFSLVAKARA